MDGIISKYEADTYVTSILLMLEFKCLYCPFVPSLSVNYNNNTNCILNYIFEAMKSCMVGVKIYCFTISF